MCLLQEYGRHLVRLQQAGLINLENTHLRHEAEQRRGHIIHTPYYTISTELYLPYLQHFIFHIYNTISISTQYLEHYIHIYCIIFTISENPQRLLIA